MSVIGNVIRLGSGGGGGLPSNMKIWEFTNPTSTVNATNVEMVKNDAWLAQHWDDDGLLITIAMTTFPNVTSFLSMIARNVVLADGTAATNRTKQCKFYVGDNNANTGTSTAGMKSGPTTGFLSTDSTGTLTFRADPQTGNYIAANMKFIIIAMLTGGAQ